MFYNMKIFSQNICTIKKKELILLTEKELKTTLKVKQFLTKKILKKFCRLKINA